MPEDKEEGQEARSAKMKKTNSMNIAASEL